MLWALPILLFSSTLEFEHVVVVILQFAQSTLDFALLHAILGPTNSGVLTGTVAKERTSAVD